MAEGQTSFVGLGQLAERTDLCSMTSYARYEAQIDEAQALRLSEPIDARRMRHDGAQAAAGRGFLPVRLNTSAKAPAAP